MSQTLDSPLCIGWQVQKQHELTVFLLSDEGRDLEPAIPDTDERVFVDLFDFETAPRIFIKIVSSGSGP